MGFAMSLRHLLDGRDDNDTTPPSSSYNKAGLLEWNEQVESFLASPTSSSSVEEESKMEDLKGDLIYISKRLLALILNAINLSDSGSQEGELSDEGTEDLTRLIVSQYRDRGGDEGVNMEQLSDSLRAVKNFLRWYLQIYSDRIGVVYPSPVRVLESDGMLDLYVLLLERYCATDSIVVSSCENDELSNAGLGRTISLLIFYATYSLLPGDEAAQKSLRHLVETLNFPELVLRILQRGPSFVTAALALSLIRNIHNILVSFQGGERIVSSTSITLYGEKEADGENQDQHWCIENINAAPDGRITYRSLLTDIAQWAIRNDDKLLVPGDDEDKRSELVNEILSTFYALRVGTELTHQPIPPDGTPNRSAAISMLIVKLIKEKFSSNSDSQRFRCKLLAVTLLMDAHPSFGSYLLDSEAVKPILDIFETQVTSVVEQTRVDPSATADLVPILVVLNKFASTSEATRALSNSQAIPFQQHVKERIFPPDAEQKYLEKVLVQQQEGAGKKNMGPLDAPRGTLRWKLMRLMTWPESHVKRCTNELLWTICSSDANEFVLRVGLGNAMPMLNLKGYIDLPK